MDTMIRESFGRLTNGGLPLVGPLIGLLLVGTMHAAEPTTPPSAEAVRQRLFLIKYSLEKLFPGQDSFPCTWTYLTCRR